MGEGEANAPVICLDGPSGVGKGTICLAVAKKLGWHILDSGSIYRITALQVSRDFPEQAINALDESQLADIAKNLSVSYVEKNNELVIFLGEEDITQLIRNEEIGAKASQVAAISPVREALLARQRAFLTKPGLIADGRDMGTVVFPDADVKFFLDASTHTRALRRFEEQKLQSSQTLDEVERDIQRRDRNDSTREVAPLKPAPDAIIIDSTELTAEAVVDLMVSHLEE